MAGKHIKFILTAALIASVLGCAGKNPEQLKQANMSYDLGANLLNKGDYPDAIQQLSNATRLNPDDPYSFNALGLAYYGEGMKGPSEDAFKKAIALNAKYSDAYNNLGVLYLSESRWSDAVKAFHAALANPLYMSPQIAQVNLGWAYYQEGKLGDAITAYRNALNIMPDMPAAHNNLGLVYMKKNMLKDAEDEFTTAIYYYKGYAEAHLNLGIVYMKTGDYAKAKEQFTTVVSLSPSSGFAVDANRYLKMLK